MGPLPEVEEWSVDYLLRHENAVKFGSAQACGDVCGPEDTIADADTSPLYARFVAGRVPSCSATGREPITDGRLQSGEICH